MAQLADGRSTTVSSGGPFVPSRAVPSEVAAAIGPFYVYVLIDPRDDQIFYVGKGTGARMAAHGRQADLAPAPGDGTKLARIREIRAAGSEPQIDVVAHHLTSEEQAFQIEAALIACLPKLTNAVAGHGVSTGRTSLDNLVSIYGAPPLAFDVPVPAMLIRLKTRWTDQHEELEAGVFRDGTGWHPWITATALFDGTRGWWKVNPDGVARRGVQHAVAVVDGITRAVYRIDGWSRRADGRSAFSGAPVGEGPVFDAYVGPLGRRAPFAAHSQNPISYWPPRPRRT